MKPNEERNAEMIRKSKKKIKYMSEWTDITRTFDIFSC